MFDRITREYDRRYGISSDHLNSIAEINFGNAKRNPNAQTRELAISRRAAFVTTTS